MSSEPNQGGQDSLASLRIAQRQIEVELIVKGVSMHGGNLTRVAGELEVSQTRLYRKFREYNLQSPVPPTHLTRSTQSAFLIETLS